MLQRLFFLTIFLTGQPNVFSQEYQPLLDDHGGTAALHISATDIGSNTQRCGAILISDRHLLTAASCVKGKESERLVSISLGREDLDQISSLGKNSYNIEEATIHPEYKNGVEEYNDLVILKTDRKVQYSNKVWPYCLPEKNQQFTPFRAVQIAGWGFVNQTHKTSFLHVAYVKLMTLARCESEWRKHALGVYENIIQSSYPEGLDDRIICAGRQGVDACIGDSGGPMTYQNSFGRHTLIGLIAKRTDCPDHPTTPGFYTNIAHYVDWIYNITGQSQQSLSKDCGGPPRPASSNPLQQPGYVKVVTDSGTSTADGSQIEADGSQIEADDSQIDADGSKIEGDVLFAGGSGNTPVDVRNAHA